MTVNENFILSECEALREHMEGAVNELRSLERFSVVASAGFWGWIGINGAKSDILDFPLAAFLPAILVLFTFFKSIALKDRYRNAANYIKRVEDELLKDSSLGWQRSEERSKSWLPEWSNYFYYFLFIINAVLATIWFIKC